MHMNDSKLSTAIDGVTVSIEDSDEWGRTASQKREAAIMAVLKKGVTDLKV